jgi:predicted nuclease of restriction endonuclease-like (RecB) superfamily
MKQRKTAKRTEAGIVPAKEPALLLADLRELILQAREGVARAVNSGLTTLYWHVGQRIRQDILNQKRADYGGQIVAALGRQLESDFGRGFGEKNLRRVIRFAEVFPDGEIVASLMRQLTWTHFVELMPLDQPLQREFYAEMCRVERWSVRTLRQKINGMLYERTALSRKPEKLAALELKQLREEDKITPDLVFRDPYILDFLGLKDTYAEKDVEAAILREMEAFILELGVGFCFVARQQRMQIDDRDYYLDLLFYHRKLRRLIAIDLKLGKFEAADKGQMELYLGWLKRYACEPHEAEPLGMILCAGKSEEHIALLELQKSGIHVASYWTEALPKKELERKLHEAVRLARARLEAAKD